MKKSTAWQIVEVIFGVLMLGAGWFAEKAMRNEIKEEIETGKEDGETE